jgi:O-antigen ligase
MHTPPVIALLITVAFIVFLFRRDIREKPNVTGALWLPLLWMLLICSRALSEWLSIFGFSLGGISLEEGSPLDAWFYFGLIAAGIYILNGRQVRLSEIVRNNGWLIVLLLYCLISIAWSDFPFVAFKRWIKDLGHPVMVLILLTEPDPEEAIRRLMKRCAYVVFPVSILFIKYYPEWGRSFDEWSGLPSNNGIAVGKNMLGADCLILGLFFFWHVLQIWRAERGIVRRNELLLCAGMLWMTWWLFSMAHSSTALVSLFIGGLTVLFVGMRSVNKNYIGSYLLAGILILAAAEITFGIYDRVLVFLNRDSTLTERTYLWDTLLKVKINPVVGTGFESFWLGERREKLWEDIRWQANEAHNGYLETYLTLGLVGLFMLIGWIIATFWKIRLKLLGNFEWGRYGLGFLVAAVVYNWTEAGFKTLHPVWFVFYLIAMDYPKPQLPAVEPSFEAMGLEENGELAYTEGESKIKEGLII